MGIASEKKAKAKAAELLKKVRNKETKAKADLAAKNEKINEGKMKKAAAKEADAKKAKAHAKEVNVKDAATGGRFAAGIGMRACRMACNSEAGWASAAGLPIPGASPLCKGKDFKRKRLASRVKRV